MSTVTYVITSWKASAQPIDTGNNHVRIEGRAEGLVAWILTQLKISPTVSISISDEQVKFQQGSIGGTQTAITPLESVCSTHFGYSKPWLKAVICAVLATFLIYVLVSAAGMHTFVAAPVALVLGFGLGILYYLLNKTVTIGFIENSGLVRSINFKRSLIENKNIDEKSAEYVMDLTQALIFNRKSVYQTTGAS